MRLYPDYYLENPDKLREGNFNYANSTYRQILELRACRAMVYGFEETPLLDIYDETGRMSFRYAFLNGAWTKDMPSHMLFGDDVVCVSVEKFLDLYKTASSASHR